MDGSLGGRGACDGRFCCNVVSGSEMESKFHNNCVESENLLSNFIRIKRIFNQTLVFLKNWNFFGKYYKMFTYN